jgi:hypothetical protein
METGVTIHLSRSGAVKEADRCGRMTFVPHEDDIAVFEVQANGTCLGDRLYEYK